MTNQIFATKNSHSQAFVDGKRAPVTMLDLPEQKILRLNTPDKQGYSSLQVAIGKKTKAPNRPLAGHLKKAGLETQPAFIREIRLDPKAELTLKPGDSLDPLSTLSSGDLVKVTAISKGKGFSGVMKRHGFAGGPRTHGQSDRQRAPGSIGRGTTPGRVLPGKKMPGRMGGVTATVKNLKVLEVTDKQVKIAGLVPGPRGGLVTLSVIKKATK